MIHSVMKLTITCSQKLNSCIYKLYSQNVRVRFAPSPTGMLHLGGLRTALYNYLFAKANDGKFILRIEDTDQSHRKEAYQEKAAVLLMTGHAYRCFCTEKRLDLLRKDATRRRENFKYDNRCRSLTCEQAQEKIATGTPHVIRLKLEHYEKPWEDMVMGPILQDVAQTEGDPILVKSNGFPTYHFANVVDDHMMGITHVLRGQEWQTSTTKHLLLYQAFGWKPPSFGHMPLILNVDGTKLSKRQGAVRVEHYREAGYLSDAVINFVTYLGGGFGTKTTAGLKLEELHHFFDIETLRVNCGKLELDKVNEFNRLHLKRQLETPTERLHILRRVRTIVVNRFGTSEIFIEERLCDSYISRVLEWALADNRIKVLQDLAKPEFQYLWLESNNTDFGSSIKMDTKIVLKKTKRYLESLDSDEYRRDVIDSKMRMFAAHSNYRYGPYMKILRQALSGLDTGPSVAEMLSVLGKEQSIVSLSNCENKLNEQI